MLPRVVARKCATILKEYTLCCWILFSQTTVSFYHCIIYLIARNIGEEWRSDTGKEPQWWLPQTEKD